MRVASEGGIDGVYIFDIGEWIEGITTFMSLSWFLVAPLNIRIVHHDYL